MNDRITPSAIPPETSASIAAELLPASGSSAGSCSIFDYQSHIILINLASSLTVRTESTSLIPFRIIPSRRASNFIAIQGVTETEKISSGLTPIWSATRVLTKTPVICWGDFTVESCGISEGMNCSAYLTHAGQAEIYKGYQIYFQFFRIAVIAISVYKYQSRHLW